MLRAILAAAMLAVACPAMADQEIVLTTKVLPQGTEGIVAGRGAYGTVAGVAFYLAEGGTGIVVASDRKLRRSEINRFTDWWVSCAVNPMDDKRICTIERWVYHPELGNKIGLFIWSDLVCSGTDFPGRSAQFRIDKQKAVTARENCASPDRSRQLIKAMRAGTEIWVRNYMWPYDYAADEKLKLDGFTAAILLRDWLDRQAEAGALKPF